MAGKKKNKKNNLIGRILRPIGRNSLRLLPWIIIAGLLGVAIWMGMRTAWSNLAVQPDFQLNPTALTFTEKPKTIRSAKMLPSLREELEEVLKGASIFDSDLCHHVQHELRASPWILHVKKVKRILPDQIAVQAIFRKPEGKVQKGNNFYMIDAGGYWLPHSLYKQPDSWEQSPPPIIIHRDLQSSPVFGRRWDGLNLAVGALFTRFITQQDIANDQAIKAIDVTNVGRPGLEADIVLTWENGVKIKWGGSDIYSQFQSLQKSPDEFPDSTKLNMLNQMLAEYPDLQGLEYVDLRFNKIYYRPNTGTDEN